MFQVHKTGASHVSIKLTIVLFYQGHACTVMDSPETRTRLIHNSTRVPVVQLATSKPSDGWDVCSNLGAVTRSGILLRRSRCVLGAF